LRHVDGPAGIVDVAQDIYPTNHWNAQAINSELTLNTVTGDIIKSSYVPLGEETVETATGPRRAKKYLLTLNRDVEVWYDEAGHWVKLRFQAFDGSMIDYFCLRCGEGPSTESAAR
jgi:hypothetical protein